MMPHQRHSIRKQRAQRLRIALTILTVFTIAVVLLFPFAAGPLGVGMVMGGAMRPTAIDPTRLRNDVRYFARVMFNVELADHQVHALEHAANVGDLYASIGRGGGKSVMAACSRAWTWWSANSTLNMTRAK